MLRTLSMKQRNALFLNDCVNNLLHRRNGFAYVVVITVYCQTSKISRTKFQNWNVSRLGLQLSVFNVDLKMLRNVIMMRLHLLMFQWATPVEIPMAKWYFTSVGYCIKHFNGNAIHTSIWRENHRSPLFIAHYTLHMPTHDGSVFESTVFNYIQLGLFSPGGPCNVFSLLWRT